MPTACRLLNSPRAQRNQRPPPLTVRARRSACARRARRVRSRIPRVARRFDSIRLGGTRARVAGGAGSRPAGIPERGRAGKPVRDRGEPARALACGIVGGSPLRRIDVARPSLRRYRPRATRRERRCRAAVAPERQPPHPALHSRAAHGIRLRPRLCAQRRRAGAGRGAGRVRARGGRSRPARAAVRRGSPADVAQAARDRAQARERGRQDGHGVMERYGGAERATISPTIARANGSSALAAMVERSLDALAPLVARLVADPAISAEAAMHVVVMNPRADPRTDPFETAILVERSFGDPARWNADYAWYARAKAQVSYREQASLRTLLRDHPERLRDDDIRVEGAVCDGGWTV